MTAEREREAREEIDAHLTEMHLTHSYRAELLDAYAAAVRDNALSLYRNQENAAGVPSPEACKHGCLVCEECAYDRAIGDAIKCVEGMPKAVEIAQRANGMVNFTFERKRSKALGPIVPKVIWAPKLVETLDALTRLRAMEGTDGL